MSPLDAAVGCPSVATKFQMECRRLRLDQLVPLRTVSPHALNSKKYQQIVASIEVLGLVEPLVVSAALDGQSFYLLDGYLRVEALKGLSIGEADCLISPDDDTYSYNRQVNRQGAVQDHDMIVQAIARGLSEERIAAALGLSTPTVKRRVSLLDGIDPQVARQMSEHNCPGNTFRQLSKMTAGRQREAASLMVAQGNFSAPFAAALVAASKPYQLVEGKQRHPVRPGPNVKAIAAVERELATLQQNVKAVEKTFGEDLLQFSVIKGYIGTLLTKAALVLWLSKHQSDYLKEFQKIVDLESLG